MIDEADLAQSTAWHCERQCESGVWTTCKWYQVETPSSMDSHGVPLTETQAGGGSYSNMTRHGTDSSALVLLLIQTHPVEIFTN